MNKLILVLIVFLVSCGLKYIDDTAPPIEIARGNITSLILMGDEELDIIEAKKEYEDMLQCLEITESVPEPMVVVYDGDYVQCGSEYGAWCTENGTIRMLEFADPEVFRAAISTYLVNEIVNECVYK